MKHLPNMDQYKDPLKIIFVNGDVWEGVKLYYAYYINSYSYVPEGDEDCLGVVYQGEHYSLRASEIKEIIGAQKMIKLKDWFVFCEFENPLNDIEEDALALRTNTPGIYSLKARGLANIELLKKPSFQDPNFKK
ncbi:hypothetical protein [Helicobacter labacensis]|uniref:hypothetical protein n=1 Tax=Helicobacter labacensis TaxID=2316079 RepID=UPI000EB4486C|nr:hypothetical protein [Helicobacter labacensis]